MIIVGEGEGIVPIPVGLDLTLKTQRQISGSMPRSSHYGRWGEKHLRQVSISFCNVDIQCPEVMWLVPTGLSQRKR